MSTNAVLSLCNIVATILLWFLDKACFGTQTLPRLIRKKNAQYIIERVLDYGDDDGVRWLWNYYDKAVIKQVVENSRCLRPDTKKFWGLMVNKKASKSST